MVENDAFYWNVWAFRGFIGKDEGLIGKCRHFFVWSDLPFVIPHNPYKARKLFFVQRPCGDACKGRKLLSFRPIFFFFFTFNPSRGVPPWMKAGRSWLRSKGIFMYRPFKRDKGSGRSFRESKGFFKTLGARHFHKERGTQCLLDLDSLRTIKSLSSLFSALSIIGTLHLTIGSEAQGAYIGSLSAGRTTQRG